MLCGPGDERKVFLRNFMRIDKPAAAFLLDGERIVTQRPDDPALGIVVLCWPGNDGKVFLCNFMGIDESMTAFLLDRVRVAHGCENPYRRGEKQMSTLRHIVASGPRHERKVLAVSFMRIHISTIAFLLDRIFSRPHKIGIHRFSPENVGRADPVAHTIA
jgi:hypothetical protein